MRYKRTSTLSIKDYHGQAIGDWLIARFLEMFWNDELINEYITSWYKRFNEVKMVELGMGDGMGIISVADYQEFLDNLLQILPKKYRKKGTAGKPWFRNVVPLVDMKYWPMTYESWIKYAEGRQLATIKNLSNEPTD